MCDKKKTVKSTSSKKPKSGLDLDDFFLDPTGTYEPPDDELFTVFSDAGYKPSDLRDMELSERYAKWLTANQRSVDSIMPLPPATFDLSYGGFGSGHQRLLWDGARLIYVAPTHDADSSDGRPLATADDDWATFAQRVSELGVLRWRRSYWNRQIVDGTQWALELDWPGIGRIKTSGSNSYPKTFNRFLAAVSTLTRGAFDRSKNLYY